MANSFQVAIDDTSLLILAGIVSLLLFSAVASRWFQPTIHPLILGRQADVSQVHQKGESPIYRNVNAPHGFDLASRPRKGVNDLNALLSSGPRGDEATHKRTVYGKTKSNEEILAEAKKFGRGLVNLVGGAAGSHQAALAVCVEVDHLEALEAILAGSSLYGEDSGKPSTPLSTLVIPPLHLPEGQPQRFPITGSESRLSAVYTTAKAVHKAVAMSIVGSDTILIFQDQEELAKASQTLSSLGGSKKPRLFSFRQVLEEARNGDVADKAASSSSSVALGQATHSSYWIGDDWINVSNLSLCAGVTAYLSFYSADSIPTPADRILVDQSPFVDSPSLHLGAAATPAGLALALTALYTGSALAAHSITSSLDDPNPVTGVQFQSYKPTLIYASPSGASSLGLALTAASKRFILGRNAHLAKLRQLRYGSLNRTSMWDSLVLNSVRGKTKTGDVRAVTIVGEGWTVGQSLLDFLRTHLGCSVVNAYLPTTPLQSLGEGEGKKEAWVTAPLNCSHLSDLQHFRANNGISEVPAHVGPPCVCVEEKVVEVIDLDSQEEADAQEKKATASKGPHGWERFKAPDDLVGTVLIRGNTIVLPPSSSSSSSESTSSQQQQQPWFSTGSPGLLRSNGTLLLLPPSLMREKREMVAIPTMSSKYPIQGGAIIGSGSGSGIGKGKSKSSGETKEKDV